MSAFDAPPGAGLRWLPLVVSAALVALALHAALESPWIGVALALLAGLVVAPLLAERRRTRQLLVSGNPDALLEAWARALERVPHRETMVPLIAATALAANGQTERARLALEQAARGEAWEAAREQRLFIETLLDAFEGERERAVGCADALVGLPLPPAGPLLRDRIRETRAATAALARAFAHRAQPGDSDLLKRAARRAPLLHWAMRYAAAVVHVDRGERDAARRLLAGAPAWPQDSAFASFHRELESHAAEPHASEP
jgi:hypothetical protein